MYLKTDIYSLFRPAYKYGSAGQKVKMISECDGILIVEDNAGERFAVKQDEISDSIDQAQHTNPLNTVPYFTTTGQKQRRSKPAESVKAKTLF